MQRWAFLQVGPVGHRRMRSVGSSLAMQRPGAVMLHKRAFAASLASRAVE